MADCCVDGVGIRLDGIVSIVCVFVMCDMCVALEDVSRHEDVVESKRGDM